MEDGFSCFEFLSVFINDDLSWSGLSDVPVKTAQETLNVLTSLKTFGVSAQNSTGAPLKALRSSFSADHKAYQRVVKTTEHIIGCQIHSMEDFYHTLCLREVGKILIDYNHAAYEFFDTAAVW